MSNRKHNLTKKEYLISFLELTKCLVNEDVTFDVYSQLLHGLCENYRKDYHHGNASQII